MLSSWAVNLLAKAQYKTIQELRNGGAVKFTTARYFTPSGRSIQAEGIEPDIQLSNLRLTKVKDNGVKRLKEADLSGHLLNSEDDESDTPDSNNTEKQSKDTKISQDYQINEALNLLKGLNIFRNKQS